LCSISRISAGERQLFGAPEKLRSRAASRTRWAGVRKQFVNTTEHAMACRVFAASFYESVLTRHAAVACARDAGRDPDISALDSEINAFNDLLAAKCGS
jgi:hypothetical protein